MKHIITIPIVIIILVGAGFWGWKTFLPQYRANSNDVTQVKPWSNCLSAILRNVPREEPRRATGMAIPEI